MIIDYDYHMYHRVLEVVKGTFILLPSTGSTECVQ